MYMTSDEAIEVIKEHNALAEERDRLRAERDALAAKLENAERERNDARRPLSAIAAIARAEQAERERDARPALTADEWRVVIRALRLFRSDHETTEPDADIETASRIIGKLGKEGA